MEKVAGGAVAGARPEPSVEDDDAAEVEGEVAAAG